MRNNIQTPIVVESGPNHEGQPVASEISAEALAQSFAELVETLESYIEALQPETAEADDTGQAPLLVLLPREDESGVDELALVLPLGPILAGMGEGELDDESLKKLAKKAGKALKKVNWGKVAKIGGAVLKGAVSGAAGGLPGILMGAAKAGIGAAVPGGIGGLVQKASGKLLQGAGRRGVAGVVNRVAGTALQQNQGKIVQAIDRAGQRWQQRWQQHHPGYQGIADVPGTQPTAGQRPVQPQVQQPRPAFRPLNPVIRAQASQVVVPQPQPVAQGGQVSGQIAGVNAAPTQFVAQDPAPQFVPQDPAPQFAQYPQDPAPQFAQYPQDPAPQFAQYPQDPAPPFDPQDPAPQFAQYPQDPAPQFAQYPQDPAPPFAQYPQDPAPQFAQYPQDPAQDGQMQNPYVQYGAYDAGQFAPDPGFQPGLEAEIEAAAPVESSGEITPEDYLLGLFGGNPSVEDLVTEVENVDGLLVWEVN